MALEHSDGSASTARLPRRPASASSSSSSVSAASGANGDSGNGSSGGGGSRSAGSTAQRAASGSEWCWYGGLGDKPLQLEKTRHRVAEVQAAYLLLERLNRGGWRRAADAFAWRAWREFEGRTYRLTENAWVGGCVGAAERWRRERFPAKTMGS